MLERLHDLIGWIADQPTPTLTAVDAQYMVMKNAMKNPGDWDEVWTVRPAATPSGAPAKQAPAPLFPLKSKTSSS